MRLTPYERFLEKTHRDLGCWFWTAYTLKGGYGEFWADGRKILAHRWSYGHFNGPIPEGMHIDHLCETRNCVNPTHLEAVTPKVNLMRGRNHVAREAGKRFCYRNHEYTEDNTVQLASGQRACRECRRLLDAKYREQRRQRKILTMKLPATGASFVPGSFRALEVVDVG